MIKKGGKISLQLPYMREQGTTNVGCKKRHISSFNQGYKSDFFSISIYLKVIISIYTLPFHIHSSVKSQRLEINSVIILKKGNCFLYLQFLCQVGLDKNTSC